MQKELRLTFRAAGTGSDPVNRDWSKNQCLNDFVLQTRT